MNYNIIKETTCKSIGIGYIVRCQSNDSIGIIYGARNSEYRTQLTDDSIVKMFFFKKDNQTEYPPYTIISYLQERETCIYPDRTIEVTNVIPLDNFIIMIKVQIPTIKYEKMDAIIVTLNGNLCQKLSHMQN